MSDFITLTEENLSREHLCCIIRSKKPHPGVEWKRAWLAQRLPEGHVFRKLDEKGCCFIEYAPLETAWVPAVGDNYLYIYCLWAAGDLKGQGYGRTLMESCIAEARAAGRSGICLLGAERQKGWLTDQNFAAKFGFETADTTPDGYRLLALSFDGTLPRFTESAKRGTVESRNLTIFYSPQCPFIHKFITEIRAYCAENQTPADLIEVDSLQKAKNLPCPFNNFAVFYGGRFRTVNLMGVKEIQKLLQKG